MKKAVLTLIFIVLASFTAQAQTTDTSVPPLINYQGLLADANGNPLIGTKKLTFNIYDAAAGGNVIWGPQVFGNVPLINGRFNVILGTTDNNGKSITEAFGAKDRYLGITVDNNSEIAPRQQILSTPFAIRAEKSEKSDVAGTVQGDNLYVHPTTGNVGINTKNPTRKLEVNGGIKATKFIGDGSSLTGVKDKGCNWEGWKCHCDAEINSGHEGHVIMGIYCNKEYGTITEFKLMDFSVSSDDCPCPNSYPGCNIYKKTEH